MQYICQVWKNMTSDVREPQYNPRDSDVSDGYKLGSSWCWPVHPATVPTRGINYDIVRSCAIILLIRVSGSRCAPPPQQVSTFCRNRTCHVAKCLWAGETFKLVWFWHVLTIFHPCFTYPVAKRKRGCFVDRVGTAFCRPEPVCNEPNFFVKVHFLFVPGIPENRGDQVPYCLKSPFPLHIKKCFVEGIKNEEPSSEKNRPGNEKWKSWCKK